MTIIIEAAANTHGCTDYCVVKRIDPGGGYVVTEAQSCSSCWQVGHDRDHVFATVGDVMTREEVERRIAASGKGAA